MVVTDRQTDRPRYSVCSKGPHLASAAMRPNNNNHNTNANVYGAVIMAMAMPGRQIPTENNEELRGVFRAGVSRVPRKKIPL